MIPSCVSFGPYMGRTISDSEGIADQLHVAGMYIHVAVAKTQNAVN